MKLLDKIKNLFQINDESIKIYDDKLKKLNEKTSQGYNDLKSLLAKYEEKQEILQTKMS